MGIKRGVTLYSYQQAQFFKQMDWRDMIREVHDNLHTDGIEIVDECLIHGYPTVSDEFADQWKEEIAKYNMHCVTMDVYLDVLQFRDHVMTHEEATERLRNDIKNAAKLGFDNIRCLVTIPVDVMEACIPDAEKYNIRLGKEIHNPFPIFMDDDVDPHAPLFRSYTPRAAEEIMELADKYHTPYIGLVPDFGIFQQEESKVLVDYQRRHTEYPEAFDFIIENKGKMDPDEIMEKASRMVPDINKQTAGIGSLASLIKPKKMAAKPEHLKEIVPYIISVHGKFYDMTEIEGCPGEYEDKSIDTEDAIKYLVEGGYDGYINSEYEGQRNQQDMGYENLPDERDQVRKHHEMLARLINKYEAGTV